MPNKPATLFVCVTCKGGEDGTGRPGRALYDTLAAGLLADAETINIRPVECLSVCKRPCTIAMAGDGRWTYVVADLDANAQASEIATTMRRYAEMPDGLIPWRERPVWMKKGTVSRIPPLSAAEERVDLSERLDK